MGVVHQDSRRALVDAIPGLVAVGTLVWWSTDQGGYFQRSWYPGTVLLLGVLADDHQYRWLFGAGAVVASCTWFTVLGTGAHRLAPLFARPGAWRVLDGMVAVVMVAVATTLLLRS